MTLLRASLPSPRYLLTSAIQAGAWSLRHIPLAEVSKQVDLVNLMAYDFVGPNFGGSVLSGHHSQLWAPLPNSDERFNLSGSVAVQYILRCGFPAFKVLLGIPLYGRSFPQSTGLHQPFHGSGGVDGCFEFWQLPRPGTKEIYDERHGAAYCIGGDGGFVTYDNAESVVTKARFALRQGLAGLFYWHIGQDRPGEESLVRIGCDVLRGRPQ